MNIVIYLIEDNLKDIKDILEKLNTYAQSYNDLNNNYNFRFKSLEGAIPKTKYNCEWKFYEPGVIGEIRDKMAMIPYIKNNKFDQEAEYRLIFDMNQLAAGEYRRLLAEKYVNIDVDGVRKPNIRIKFGNQYKADNEESLSVYYSDNTLSDMMRDFERKCKSDRIAVRTVRKVRKYKMDSREILISEGRNQEKICYLLRRMLPDEKYKVWCDGHLPIRRIIVGPSKDAEFMKNSIREYIKTKYWAESIDVELSKIPLRT